MPNAPPIKTKIDIINDFEYMSKIQNIQINKTQTEKANEIMQNNDRELNDLEYNSALKYDNRTFFQYYYSLLRTEHKLMKVLNSGDYNSKMIKIYLCFYGFSLSFTINALFFDDEAIEQIFLDNGQFNLLYQIPQIIYSSIITFLLSGVLDLLAYSEDDMLLFKNEKISKNIENNAKKLWIVLQIKFLYFFIISFLLMLISWYYIICFCAVYINTQIHLLKDTIIGFATSILNPFLLKLIPTIFRIYGLKHRISFVFKLSKIFEIIC